MTRRVRNLISTAFIAAFLVTAPLVVLSTAGYKYSWKKGKIEKTGIIQADSVPDGAAILLNGVRQQRETPASFPRLLPEDYRVRFERDGYFAWEKQVEVRSGATTFVTDAALIKDALPLLRFPGQVSGAAFTKDGMRVAFLMTTEGREELMTLDADETSPTLLARFTTDAHDEQKIAWSPDGRRILYSARVADGTPVFQLYDAAGSTTPVALDLQDARAQVRGVSWSSDGSRLTLVTSDGVSVADAEDGIAEIAALIPDLKDARLRDRALFTLRPGENGTLLERRTLGDDRAEALSEFPSGNYRFIQEDGPYLLIADVGRRRILVVSLEDGTVADEITGTDARWLPKSREPRLLAWNDFEITVSAVREKRHVLVTRLGTKIDGCAWHPSGLAVFYATNGGIHAADLDRREPRNVFELARFPEIGAFTVDATAGLLRFSGAVGNQRGLYEREF